MPACHSIDLKVRRASIHAIVGENGAGKSTAMKILYGMLAPDAGEILLQGENVRWKSPLDAIRAGVGMVHQHFMLAPPYSVLENVILGAEPRFFCGWIDRARARKKLEGISARYGLRADWDARVSELGVGIRQRIEIIKLLYRDAQVLILDEPTAVLTPGETNELFEQLRKLRDEGKTILIITHKLKEVLALADEVTVFRQGRVVGHRRTAETDADDLATLMVGRKVSLRAQAPASVGSAGETVLAVNRLSLLLDQQRCLSEVDFEVRAGEIVGIAGVEGNGQSELLALIARPEEFRKKGWDGTIRVLGSPTLERARHRAFSASAAQVRALGVGVIPEDRHHEGLLLDRPIVESFLLGRQRESPWSRRGILFPRVLARKYREAAEEYDVRPRSSALEAKNFSGGNQQKVIIARELAPREAKAPRLIIAAQPTRGVDVGAIEMIHARLLRARAEGAGVLLVSSELDEILALSDRVLVLYGGRIAASFDRAQGVIDESSVGVAMGGGSIP